MDELKKPHDDVAKSGQTLEIVERNYIKRVLEQVQWKVSGKTVRPKSLDWIAAPYVPACVNSISANLEFSFQFQIAFIFPFPALKKNGLRP